MNPILTEALATATAIRKRRETISQLQEINLEDKCKLGRLVASLRKSAGLSQRAAAPLLEAAGVSPHNLIAIEKPSPVRHASPLQSIRAARAFAAEIERVNRA